MRATKATLNRAANACRLQSCDRYCFTALLFSAVNTCCGLPTTTASRTAKSNKLPVLPESLTDAGALAEHARRAPSHPQLPQQSRSRHADAHERRRAHGRQSSQVRPGRARRGGQTSGSGGAVGPARQRRAAGRRRRESRGTFGDAVGGRRWVHRSGVLGAVDQAGLALALDLAERGGGRPLVDALRVCERPQGQYEYRTWDSRVPAIPMSMCARARSRGRMQIV